MRRIYLDHNATTPLDDDVCDAMVQALRSLDGNPSSIHREGQRARAAVEHARRQVALLLGADTTEITFTSGATEANNLALETLAAATDGALASTAVEHPSILAPLERLAQTGRPVLKLNVDAEGMLPATDEIIAQAEAAEVGALSVMLANNETGNLFEIAPLIEAAHQRGWLVHCDATQIVGKMPLDVEALGADMVSISAHKFYGPTGVGALYLRSDAELTPVIVGGHQERGRRGGTENVAAIVGMGLAAELAARRTTTDATHMASLRDRLWEGVQRVEAQVARQTHPTRCLPNTLNVRFPDVDGETLLINLDLEGISVSAGSACTAGSLEPSHVILAMGVPYDAARGSVRFSLGRNTTADDIELVVERLPLVLQRTRSQALW